MGYIGYGQDTNLGHQVFGSGLKEMFELLGVDIGIGQLVPNGFAHHLRYHVLAHFLPKELDLRRDQKCNNNI